MTRAGPAGAQQQAGGNHATPSDSIRGDADHRPRRQRRDRLQAKQPSDLRCAQPERLARVERQECAQRAVENELSGLRHAGGQDQAFPHDHPDAAREWLPARAGRGCARPARPACHDCRYRQRQHPGHDERGIQTPARHQVARHNRTDGLAGALHRRIGTSHAPRRWGGARSERLADATGPKIAVALPCRTRSAMRTPRPATAR